MKDNQITTNKKSPFRLNTQEIRSEPEFQNQTKRPKPCPPDLDALISLYESENILREGPTKIFNKFIFDRALNNMEEHVSKYYFDECFPHRDFDTFMRCYQEYLHESHVDTTTKLSGIAFAFGY